jgi:hypothetical protein
MPLELVNMFDNLINKEVEVIVQYKHSEKPFFYHGKLLSEDKNGIFIDDIKEGKLFLNKNVIISVNEMTRGKKFLLAAKFDTFYQQLKREDAKFDEMIKKFKDKLREELKE